MHRWGYQVAEQADDEDDRIEERIDEERQSMAPMPDDLDQDGAGNDSIEGGDADDELEVVFGDEAAPASKGDDSGLVRKLRDEIRKRDERLATLERGQQPQKIEVGDKPTLETCEYDEAKFEEALDAWKERKAEVEQADAHAQKQTQAQQARFAEKMGDFQRNKTALAARDFEAAEETVVSTLSQVQQAIVVKAADNSAAVIYALGRHPQKLATLSAIDDPIEFTAALVKLEGTLKVTKRTRTPPEVDTPARGSAPLSQTSDKELERLEKEAAKTGDRTKVVAHKRKLKSQGRS